VTVIAIGVVVVVIPIGAAATTDAAIRIHRCRRRVWALVGGVVVNDNAVPADAPAATSLPPSDATDPTAAEMK
jgi:hypothetical protein